MAHISLIPAHSLRSASGAKCYIHGDAPGKSVPGDRQSPDEPVVDLDTWIDQEGNLEIGLRAARDIANAIGYVSEDEYQAVIEERDALLAEVGYLEAEIEAKSDAVDVLAGELAARAQDAVDERVVS